MLEEHEAEMTPETLTSMPLYYDFLRARPYWHSKTRNRKAMSFPDGHSRNLLTQACITQPKTHCHSPISLRNIDLSSSRICKRNCSCSQRGSKIGMLPAFKTGILKLCSPIMCGALMALKCMNTAGFIACVGASLGCQQSLFNLVLTSPGRC